MEKDQHQLNMCYQETVQQKNKQLQETQQQTIIGHTHLQTYQNTMHKETKLHTQ